MKEKHMKLMAGVELKDRYGNVPTNTHLKVLDVGFDWVLVKHKGRNVYIPISYTQDIK